MKDWSYVKSSQIPPSLGKICLQHQEVIKQGKCIAGGWVHCGDDGVTILHQLFPVPGNCQTKRFSALSLASSWHFEIHPENRNCKDLSVYGMKSLLVLIIQCMSYTSIYSLVTQHSNYNQWTTATTVPRDKMAHTSLAILESKPEVGSSRKTTMGCEMSAKATLTRLASAHSRESRESTISTCGCQVTCPPEMPRLNTLPITSVTASTMQEESCAMHGYDMQWTFVLKIRVRRTLLGISVQLLKLWSSSTLHQVTVFWHLFKRSCWITCIMHIENWPWHLGSLKVHLQTCSWVLECPKPPAPMPWDIGLSWSIQGYRQGTLSTRLRFSWYGVDRGSFISAVYINILTPNNLGVAEFAGNEWGRIKIGWNDSKCLQWNKG